MSITWLDSLPKTHSSNWLDCQPTRRYPFFSSLEPIRVAPGGVYATYSKEIHSEGLWYRVKVVKVKADNVQIEYLDYGETGTVAVSSLRIIPQRFLELPFQVCNTGSLLIET